MRTLAHAHKLKRHRYKSTGTTVYFCVLNCGFKVETHLSLGKKVVCWRCGREFSMNEYSIRLAKPHCNDCTKSKTEQALTAEDVVVTAVNDSISSMRERLNALEQPVGKADDEGEM